MSNASEVVCHAEEREYLPCSCPDHHPCSNLLELTRRLIDIDLNVWVPGERYCQSQATDTATTTGLRVSAATDG